MADQKITVSMPEQAVKDLDDYMAKGLFGSRGRAIQGLMRDLKATKESFRELQALATQITNNMTQTTQTKEK